MIVGVAIRNDFMVIMLPKPNRHHHCFEYAKMVGIHATEVRLGLRGEDQGFYTDKGKYLNRQQAFHYVKRIKQPLRDEDAKAYLFSEDLW